MSTTTLHRAVSSDGTEIVGRVVGEGPPLVLVHGAIGDGEYAWTQMLPHLSGRYRCYLPSTRGRGLSGDHPDHSLSRLSEDITAFVASIDEPVGLVGWSGGGPLVLGAAQRVDTVTGVAVWEGAMDLSVAPPEVVADFGRLGAAVEQAGIAAAAGRPTDAVRAFLIGICTDEELALIEPDVYEQWSGGIPDLLDFFGQMAAGQGFESLVPEAMARVSAPTSFLVGTRTLLADAFATASGLLAVAVQHGRRREVEGAGHFAPMVAPELVADELSAFFQEVARPAGTR